MTDLSNIFVGKRVVQKAYLNNALIYQSKGWQALPSTCSEVWTKYYDAETALNCMARDDADNIYIGVKNCIYKLDSSGNIKWKFRFSIPEGDYYSRAIVVVQKYIYYSFYCPSGSGSFMSYISKIDADTGKVIMHNYISDIIGYTQSRWLWIGTMKADKSYIYISVINSNNSSDYAIYKLDLNLNKVAANFTFNIPINHIEVCSNEPYIFIVYNGIHICRLNKDNLDKKVELTIPNGQQDVDCIKQNNLGNIYVSCYSDSEIYKYSIENCKFIKGFYPTSGTYNFIYAFDIDTQDSLYILSYTNSDFYLSKISSDDTISWKNIPTFDYDSRYTPKIITDSNNNIYIAYLDYSTSILTLKKYLNLVKES